MRAILLNIRWGTGLSIGLFIGMGSLFYRSPALVLSPLMPLGPSSDAPPAASLPGQEKIIDLPALKNYIEDYYPTVFADYFGPAP